MNVQVRQYQEQSLDALCQHLKKVRPNSKGVRSALVNMATGLGKTILVAQWAKKQLAHKKFGLFLCHDNSGLEQAMNEFRKVCGESYSFGYFHGEIKDFEPVDVLFASFQTMHKWKGAFLKNEFDFIIHDEAHHAKAETFADVLQYFQPHYLIGLTATPERMDGQDIREYFGQDAVRIELEEALAMGYLAKVEYHVISDNLNTSKLKKIVADVLEGNKKISIRQLNETIFIKPRDESIAKMITSYDKKTIIFCERIEHAENFIQHLPKGKAKTYHSALSKKEQKQIWHDFQHGDLQYILTVNMFNEIRDIPHAELIVFLRCTNSKTIFFQQLGRGLRLISGKERVIILDFVANCERITMLRELAEKIQKKSKRQLKPDALHIAGKASDFIFSDLQLDIFKILQRIKLGFYKTYQEASNATIRLGIKTSKAYGACYKRDPRLPSEPFKIYAVDWQGWPNFLGQQKVRPRKSSDFYETYEEASKAAKKLGIKTSVGYRKYGYRKDPRLPRNPDRIYALSWKNWKAFLGNDDLRDKRKRRRYKRGGFYTTYKKASKAAKKLGIKTRGKYQKYYHKDACLPAAPEKVYESDWQGWPDFLGQQLSPPRKSSDLYPTYAEASKSAQKLGIKTSIEYRQQKLYTGDSRLPSNPQEVYESRGWVSWPDFLGTAKKK